MNWQAGQAEHGRGNRPRMIYNGLPLHGLKGRLKNFDYLVDGRPQLVFQRLISWQVCEGCLERSTFAQFLKGNQFSVGFCENNPVDQRCAIG